MNFDLGRKLHNILNTFLKKSHISVMPFIQMCIYKHHEQITRQ